MNVRIIPRLDIKGPNLVKGIHFEGLRVLGKPERFARHYYENGADELLYYDAVASLYGRNSLLETVRRTADEVFIPLCVAGGLRTVEDIRAVLRSGADKVSVNTAAVARPELIREASRAFGSSTLVISIEAMRKPQGGYEVYTDFGRQATGIDANDWALRAVELGAGELLVTSIEMEGTGKGYDVALTRRIAEAVPVPVIAAGGAGTSQHVVEVVRDGWADAVCAASLLHYRCARRFAVDPGEFADEGNIQSLRRGPQFAAVSDTDLPELKRHLQAAGISCRQATGGRV
ncbi:MAG TPA: imidazole glycerol phosphate synthase cyclase subunit [Planctomycetota bacterium]|nr:imidazole glycerol phosphate synthase cyclase subunit [Planctomycetota bacterium]